jgi:hypothetical protein
VCNWGVSAEGEELLIDSDRTLNGSILHGISVSHLESRSQLVIAVRRAKRVMFHTFVREQAALVIQCAVRCSRARRRVSKEQARQFRQSLYLGRYQIDGLPSLCQHRQLVAQLSRLHKMTQEQALAEVDRKLASIASALEQALEFDSKAGNSMRHLSTVLGPRPPTPQPSLTCAAAHQDTSAALQGTADSSEQDGGDKGGHFREMRGRREEAAAAYGKSRCRKQMQVVEESQRIKQVSEHSLAACQDGKTQAARMRQTIHNLALMSHTRHYLPLARCRTAHALADGDGEEGEGEERGVVHADCHQQEVKAGWRDQVARQGHETGKERIQAANQDQEKQQAANQHQAVSGTPHTGLGGRASTPRLLKGPWVATAVHAFDQGAIEGLDWLTGTDCLPQYGSLADKATTGFGSRVLIRFSSMEDQVHRRHLAVLRKCQGPFVIPVLDTAEPPDSDKQAISGFASSDAHVLGTRAAPHIMTPLARRQALARETQLKVAEVTANQCIISSPPRKVVGSGSRSEQQELLLLDASRVPGDKQKRKARQGGIGVCASAREQSERACRVTSRSESRVDGEVLRCAMVMPLPTRSMHEELHARLQTGSTIEPLVLWVGGLLTFLHMKKVCLVQLRAEDVVLLSDGSWRVMDLSYSRSFGSRLATHDGYLLKQLQEQCLVPEVLMAAERDELNPDNVTRMELLAGPALDIFNFGLFIHLAITGRDYFQTRASAREQVVVNRYPLQMLESFKWHAAVQMLFDKVLLRSANARAPLPQVLDDFKQAMLLVRKQERDKQESLVRDDGGGVHTAVKAALKDIPVAARDAVLKARSWS